MMFSSVPQPITTALNVRSSSSGATVISTPPSSHKYHHLHTCDSTLGIDSLLRRYRQDRQEVISLLVQDPTQLIATIWTAEGPLAIDTECRCQMGQGDYRSSFACAQCKNLRRIVDLRTGGIEREFTIECGRAAGSKLIVSQLPIATPYLKWDPIAADRARSYIRQYQNLTLCGTPELTELKCITGDAFTISTLIQWMIAQKFELAGLPHIPTLHTAFICRNHGYSLTEVPSIGAISKLPMEYFQPGTKILHPEIARSIWLQLLVILTELTSINFSHGTPNRRALLFKADPVSYAYRGAKVIGPCTLQITNFGQAAATFNSIHFFPEDMQSTLSLEKHMFIPEIATQRVSMASCSDGDVSSTKECQPASVPMYKLSLATADIYRAMRHIGFPLYPGSLDFYCLILSLMQEPAFYSSVKSDPKLNRLWGMMWLKDDQSRIESLLTASTEISSRDRQTSAFGEANKNPIDPMDLLRGVWLRCDIISLEWSLVQSGV